MIGQKVSTKPPNSFSRRSTIIFLSLIILSLPLYTGNLSAADTQNKPPTWQLVGIINDNPTEQAVLLERIANKKQSIYFIGDTIPNLGKLSLVKNNYATFQYKNSDRFTVLYLFSGSTQSSNKESIEITPSETVTLDAEEYLSYRWEKNGKSIFGKTRQFLLKEEDSIIGIELKDIAPDTFVHAIGMQDGDILTSINGKPIQKTGDIFLSLIKNQGVALELTYTRKNSPQKALVRLRLS
jgi:type II secretory pathway component PulC